MRSIQFYRTENGRSPVEDFLDSLSDKQAQKVVWVFRLVERLGRVPEYYLKKLVGTEDLWEIRAQVGGDAFRFLGFFDGSDMVIITNAFSKKQQKTPMQEIRRAQGRRAEYFRRKQQ